MNRRPCTLTGRYHHTHITLCHRRATMFTFVSTFTKCRRFDPGGVPGPTSKLSPRVPAQMGRRETEHEGGGAKKETGRKGETRGLRVVLLPGRVRLQ
jgi:hypothetical protein